MPEMSDARSMPVAVTLSEPDNKVTFKLALKSEDPAVAIVGQNIPLADT